LKVAGSLLEILISFEEGWVTDEFHTALAFAERGMTLLLGLLRQGEHLPEGFRMFAPGEAGNTFDVRDTSELLSVLDRYFVQFGSSPDGDASVQAATALHQSSRSMRQGDVQSALDEVSAACELVPELPDGFAQRARILYRTGHPYAALSDAKRALEIDPTLDEMLIFAAASAADLQRWQKAASFARLAVERNRSQANAHFLLGQALDAQDQVQAALCHFMLARRAGLRLPNLYNVGGTAWRRSGAPLQALDWYRAGLKMSPHAAPLLVNATAGAMEAGLPTEAYHFLQELLTYHPSRPEVEALAGILAQWCSQDGPLPVLSRQVPLPESSATVDCSACDNHLVLHNGDSMLCSGCGTVLDSSMQQCKYCGCAGKVLPTVALMRCPICARGELSVKYKN
jgi:tetratricopeptide (TPR) repeat protein